MNREVDKYPTEVNYLRLAREEEKCSLVLTLLRSRPSDGTVCPHWPTSTGAGAPHRLRDPVLVPGGRRPHRQGSVQWTAAEDILFLVAGSSNALISGSEEHTVFIKNSIRKSVNWIKKIFQIICSIKSLCLTDRHRFSYFGDQYHRNNLINGTVCSYQSGTPSTWLCNIFKLGWNSRLRSEATISVWSRLGLCKAAR